MKAFIRKLFSLISAGEFIGVLAFCSIAAILEGYSVYHLSKFVGFVVSVPENNSEDWYTVRVLSYMYNSFGELFFIISTLSVVIITSIISAMTVFQITKFVSFRGIQVSNDVISNIISYPHVHQGITRDSLSSTISFEIERFTLQVLLPIFQLISKGSILFAITAVVLIQYPSQTIVLIAIFTLYYVLIYLILRPQLEKNGANISKFLEFRIKIASSIFNNYRFLYSSKKFDFLFSEFKLTGSAQASAQARIQFLSQISRFILEIIIFGTIIVYLAWNSKNYNEETPQLLATIGFAAFKLFPTMQSLFTNLTTIRGNYESINRLLNYKNLSNFADKPCESEILLSSQVNSLCVKIKRGTKVNSVQFNDFEFCFKRGKVYALTGMSGVGKSTFLDLISTYRNVENIVIKKPGSSNMSYLPQTSEMAPFGIVENVALSYPDEADRGEVFKILGALGISNKLKISAGISGGQLQRLSIARALFNRPDILIMDEPTSALDSDNVSLVKSLLLEELKYGATIILVTHQKDLCDIADCILNFQRSQGLVNIQIQEAVN